MTTWQEHLKKCAREWQEMKRAKQNAEKTRKRTKPPEKVPRRVRGKQVDPARDIN
jgi:hypothetical protein